MAPKRRLLNDDPEEFEYPAALVPSVKDMVWDSPTKAAKQYQRPFERRTKPTRREHKASEGRMENGMNGQPDDIIVNFESGPFPSAESAQTTSTEITDLKIDQYLEAVEACTAGLFHLGGLIFVVEGWDISRGQSTGTWYHLQYLRVHNDELCVACTCPQGLQDNCIHREFLKVYSVEHLLTGEGRNDAECPPVVMFQRQQVLSMPDFISTFSVKSLSSSALKGRAIVTHTGSSVSTGIWRCSKDSGTNGACPHVASARKALQDLIGTNNDEVEANLSDGISSKSLARRQFIGPDLREYGLFNYNNTILVSHELLDEYTMSFVSSKTPFTAFVSVLSHRYTVSGATFMGEDLFRSIWFSYASLQALENDFRCTRCGPYPEAVIWDGITLAFGRKHLSSTLSPPTQISPHSRICPQIKNHPKQQLISDVRLRRQLREVLNVPNLDLLLSSDDADADDEETGEQIDEVARERRARRVRDHLDKVQSVYTGLSAECGALASLFLDAYGAVAFSSRRPIPVSYRSFFLQIAAEESILQMINGALLNDLLSFLSHPQKSELTRIISIPALYNVLASQPLVEPLVPLLQWLANEASATLQSLITKDGGIESAGNSEISEMGLDWKMSGCLYSLPQIRYRPKYPHLKTDQKKDVSTRRGDRCGKYYTQYGERRLTGGIMVAWCTHSICYGFHCIPESEGRNDVFSAMVTRWPVAPKRVIYDFACALGPYCMLREPQFFKNTFFCIDHFHATGHTKCSPAAFLSEYANVDPSLVSLNSSAGECATPDVEVESYFQIDQRPPLC
ncbi:hypothetical protein H1R20_g856, partial [Candolleomyces eurysporus]